MKKLVLILITVLVILFIPNVHAEALSIEDIKVLSKSETTAILNEATYSDLKIQFDIKFTNINDFVKYKIVINNPTNEDYEIKETNNNMSEYIKYEYSYDDNNRIIERNKKTTIFINIKYDKQVPDDILLKEEFSETNSIEINLENEINPNTGRIIVKSLIIILIILGITLTIYVNKIKSKKFILIIITLLAIPISVYAIKYLTIHVDSKISIEQPTHFYIYDIPYRYEQGMTWGEWLDSNYNTINAYKAQYYEKHLNSNYPDGYYNYFDNNEYGIIVNEFTSSCGDQQSTTIISYIHIIDSKNVTPEDLIKDRFEYSLSDQVEC